jgi:hypothetical protein
MRRLTCVLALATAVALGAAGCSTTTASIEQAWYSPTLQPGTLTNVVTLSPTGDGALSRTAEDQLAQDLNARGIRAVPGYRVIPPAARNNRDAALASLRNSGYDGIVTMRFVGATQKLDYYPTFDMYWGAAWGAVYPETIVRIELNAYTLPNNRLVWSAISKSVDPDSVGEVIDDVTEVAAQNLAQHAVIATK